MPKSISGEGARSDGALTPAESKRLIALIKQSPVNQAAIGIRLGKQDGYVSALVNGKTGASLARWRQIAAIIGLDNVGEIFAVKSPMPVQLPVAEYRTPADVAREMMRLARVLQDMTVATPPQPVLSPAEEAAVAAANLHTQRAVEQAETTRTRRGRTGTSA